MSDLSKYIVNPGPKTPVKGLKAAVTTDSAIVTETIMKVLNSGGNAADAVIAGAMVQAAVEPFMTNHAGLVTMLYYEAKTGQIHQLDSLGGHPSGLPPFKPVPPGMGGYAITPPSAIIPGFMPGLKAIHEKFATKDWADLCADAVYWAETGHEVSTFEYGVNLFGEKFVTYFPEGREFYQPNGYFPNVGDIFTPPGMAETLRGVRDNGPDHMITGAWAEAFVAKGNELGWKVTLDHMTETPPRWVEPLRFEYNEYEVVFLGPPQAQGFFTSIALGILKHLGIRDMEPGSAEHIWAMGHALRQGARHWEYARDDQVYGVPRAEVLDDGYHAHLAKMIRGSRPKVDLSEHIRLSGEGTGATDMMSQLGGGAGRPRLIAHHDKQPTGSCEIAVVDNEGNWCQFMDTLQGSGIPGQVVGGVPMVGSHATFGALQSPMDATLIKGAKARCIIGNTLVLKDGKPVFSAGSPGNIHCTLPQVLTYLLDFKLDPYAAVDAPRMLPMSDGQLVAIEDRLARGVVEDLNKLGVRVGALPGYDFHMGSFSVIARDEASGTLTAVADPRRCAVAAVPSPTASRSDVMTSASLALGELAERYWAFRCDEHPLEAILAGVAASTDRLTRDAPADYDRRAAWATQALGELDQIDFDALSQTEGATFMLLRGELAALVDMVAQQAHLRPSIYPLGPEFMLANWASMTSIATADDARLYIDRMRQLPDALAEVQSRLSLGLDRGIRYPKLVVERAIGVVKGQASVEVEANSFFGPLKVLTMRGAAFADLVEEGRSVVAGAIVSAFLGYAGFLEETLLPAARDELGCTSDVDGMGHYRFLIRQFTTTDMAPDDIHAVGLAEVERITGEMDAVAEQAGFAGDLPGFKRHLQTDNSQLLESGDALRETIEVLSKRIDARIPEFYGRIPRATYGVKSIPEAIAAAMPPAYAQPNPADNSAAGVHWITSIPSKLPRYMHIPIALHEAWPGHLMHLALIQELTDLPAFRRHGAMNYSACLEGWALYSEGMGEDMGFYDTPDKRYGRLEMEMWRAVRLVVDTGLHTKGWGRAQAIDYFRAHMALPIETVEAEVDRYIGLPGQALGYQLGNLKFRELRARAEEALASRFDIRAFNDALASAGAVSLVVLEQTIDAWIVAQQSEAAVAA